MIRSCRVPLVFTRVGTSEIAHGRQKTVFSVGTVYFRHGAKSEPGTSEKDIKFCYTQNYATPRYSEAFVDWVVQKYEEDESFFNKTKQQFDQVKRGVV